MAMFSKVVRPSGYTSLIVCTDAPAATSGAQACSGITGSPHAAADHGLGLEGAARAEGRHEIALVAAFLLELAGYRGAVDRDVDRHLVGRALGGAGGIDAGPRPGIGRCLRQHRQGREAETKCK